jgi:uncharacterized protein YkwD
MGVLVSGGVLVSPATAVTSASTIESLLVQEINDARAANGKGALVRHSGLSAQARTHSQNMAAAGELSHDGFEARLQNATPDPSEANGPPDDGFTGAACENVAFRSTPGETDAQAAEGLVTQWLNSPPHRECMLDTANDNLNVAGVGVFIDASNGVWATLIPARDTTPPGSSGGNGGGTGGGTGGLPNFGGFFSSFFGGGGTGLFGGGGTGLSFFNFGGFNLSNLFGGFQFPFLSAFEADVDPQDV